MIRPVSGIPLCLVFACSLLSACGGEGSETPPPVTTGCSRTVSTNITSATTWAPGDPACEYAIEGSLEVSAALTIAPGTVVRFGPNAGLMVKETGSLNAVGTEASPITFTGRNSTPGSWKGLAFRSNDTANVLDHAIISFAGSEAEFCCDYFHGPGGSVEVQAAVVVGGGVLDSVSQVRIANTVVEKSGTFGLFTFNKARLPGFTRNIFRDNTKAPVSVSLSIVGSLDNTSRYSQGNGDNTVHVIDAPDSDSTATQTLHKLDVPYGMSTGFADTTLEYGGALTIEAGVRLEFEADSGLVIASAGSLVANGTATDRIVFTGRTASPGYWKGISIRSRTSTNTLAYADVMQGGSSAFCCDYFTGPGGGTEVKANVSVGGAVSSGSALLKISNSRLAQSGRWGLFIFKNSAATQSANTFSDNTTNVQDENTPFAP